MEMPKVTEQQQRLTKFFQGTWRGEEKLHPSDFDPKGGTAFGTWNVQPSLDGFFLLVDYIEEKEGRIVYRGHGVHTWDARDKAYKTFWFDNMGFVQNHAHTVTFEGNKYTYVGDEGPFGRPRFTYVFHENRFDFTIEYTKDGGKTFTPMHEGRYTRVI